MMPHPSFRAGHRGPISDGAAHKRRTSVMPAGKTLMPGGFTPPEQIKSLGAPNALHWGDCRRHDLAGRFLLS